MEWLDSATRSERFEPVYSQIVSSPYNECKVRTASSV
jgi:hypothetical protein